MIRNEVYYTGGPCNGKEFVVVPTIGSTVMPEPFHQKRREKAEIDYLMTLERLRRETGNAPTFQHIGKQIGLSEEEASKLTDELLQKGDVDGYGSSMVGLSRQGSFRLADIQHEQSMPWWRRLWRSVPSAPFWIAMWELLKGVFITGKVPDWLVMLGRWVARRFN
ncbi:MAG TPA: hypothetical protein VGZ22_26445 [Isosphaeraceae bacterium]|nr:hypothetical protein [Isosphaeraceae bacterium]